MRKPGELDHVLEACSGEERELGALALDDRVDADGGAVDEGFDVSGIDAVLALAAG